VFYSFDSLGWCLAQPEIEVGFVCFIKRRQRHARSIDSAFINHNESQSGHRRRSISPELREIKPGQRPGLTEVSHAALPLL
jgi:hypothetical protein